MINRMNNINKYFILIVIVFLTSCATQRESVIVGCDYNKKTNTTDYFVFPYGSVSLPGKWEKTGYNSNSHQQFFKNPDSVVIAVAFGTYDKYEFNKDKSKKGLDFLLAYYAWDSEYFVETFGLKRALIEKDSVNNFLIYKVFGGNKNIDTYFLLGEKNGFVTNFSIMNTDKWNEKYKIDFLKINHIMKREQLEARFEQSRQLTFPVAV